MNLKNRDMMKLLEATTLGNRTLQNRMAMAPMTRSRATTEGVVGEMTVLYYTQRASAGLLITEGVNISPQAIGGPWTPGIYTQAQIDGWKKVTQAVHANNGVIYAQLWHTGRASHSSVKQGELPVAPSAVAISGQQVFTPEGLKEHETPRALSTAEVKQTIQDYKQAAINALAAGFDGVELHGANGYLPHQFLADNANQRTDEYGGSIENRNRFVLEIMNALVDAIGSDKVGIRLSPTNPYNDILHQDPTTQYTQLLQELNKLPLAYVHLMNALFPTDKMPHYPKDVLATFGPITNHPIIINGGYTRESGEAVLDGGHAQLVSYGALFLANPDLPKRFALNAALNQPDRATMFGGGAQGYTDYPFLAA